MNYKQYRQQLDEIFSGRNTLYHATDEEGAEYIKQDRAFNISGKDEYMYDEGDEDTKIHPYISFARSRGTSYRVNQARDFVVVYEFNKNVIRRNTKRERASFEPYDFWEVDYGDARWRGGRGRVNRSQPRKAYGESEMEERLWFNGDEYRSKGVFDSIDKVHIVFKNSRMPLDRLERLLDRVEIDGVDTLFYKDHRDWVQGKAMFDPFEYFADREAEMERARAKHLERPRNDMFAIPKPGG